MQTSLKTSAPNIFRAFVAAETLVILILFFSIVYRVYDTHKTNTDKQIVPLNKDNLIFPSDSALDQFYEPKPDSLQEDKPSWLPKKVVYSINTDSLNDRFNYPVLKEGNVFRIITLGDSFTFGQFVNTNENWTELLEDMLNKTHCGNSKKFEVINLGMSGYDILFSSHRFMVRGTKYNPDLVVWLLNEHNFYTMPQLYKTRFEELNNQTTEEEKRKEERKGNYSLAWDQAMNEIQKQYNTSSIIEQENAAFYELSKQYSKPIIFIINNVTPRFIGLLKIFRNSRKDPTYINGQLIHMDDYPNFRHPDSHPNKDGHIFIANHVYQYLTENTLLPCNN